MPDSFFTGIDTVIIRVSDRAASLNWYKEKLGFSETYRDDSAGLIVLDTGTPTSLTLWRTDTVIRNNRETSSFPIFRTTDARSARAALAGNSVKTGDLVSDDAVDFFTFEDPDGNLLEACQVKA